jgi:hypothetical protein
MATFSSAIDALNDMCLDAGAAGGHTQQIAALNALAVKLGKPGGYTRLIDAYNAIAGGTSYQFDIQALNDICGDLGLATTATLDTVALTLVANAGFTPAVTDPSFASVVLLMGFEGADAATTSTDEAKGKAVTFVGNAQLDTAQKKFGTSALLLDGTGDFLTLADHADWDFAGGQFTVECWVRFNSVAGTSDLVGQWDAGTGFCGWRLAWSQPDANLYFMFYDSGGNLRYANFAWAPSTATWYHVAADRNAAGVIRLYVNGTMLGKATLAQTFQNSPKGLTIGCIDHPTPNYLSGWLDEIRITKGVARYASDSGYTLPIAAFPRS